MFRSIDLFGQSVNFTYDGEDQFKTTFGAVLSLIIILILLGFGIYKAVYLFSKFNPNVIKTTLMYDISDLQEYRPQDLGFDFSFGIGESLDPSYGYYSVKYNRDVLAYNN